MKKFVILFFVIIFALPWCMSFAQSDTNRQVKNTEKNEKVEAHKVKSTMDVTQTFEYKRTQRIIMQKIYFLGSTMPRIMIFIIILIIIFLTFLCRYSQSEGNEVERFLGVIVSFAIIVALILTSINVLDCVYLDNQVVCNSNQFGAASAVFLSLLLFIYPGIVFISEARRGLVKANSTIFSLIVFLSTCSLLTSILSILLAWNV